MFPWRLRRREVSLTRRLYEGKEAYQSDRGWREILDLGSLSSIVPGTLPGGWLHYNNHCLSKTRLSRLKKRKCQLQWLPEGGFVCRFIILLAKFRWHMPESKKKASPEHQENLHWFILHHISYIMYDYVWLCVRGANCTKWRQWTKCSLMQH